MIVIDIHHRYPRVYMHCHSLLTQATRPHGFRQERPSEVYNLCNQLASMVIDSNNDADGGEVATMKNLIDGKCIQYLSRKSILSIHTSPQTIIFLGKMLWRLLVRMDLG
jgi:hypothetical protein